VEDVVYKGCRIQPHALALPSGRFGAKALIWRFDEAAGRTHLIHPPGRWDSEDEAIQQAIAAGKRLIDSGLAWLSPPGTRDE
jgi:hypothetical protein